jgi:hypothetical protein
MINFFIRPHISKNIGDGRKCDNYLMLTILPFTIIFTFYNKFYV